jgi:hypothetical protein
VSMGCIVEMVFPCLADQSTYQAEGTWPVIELSFMGEEVACKGETGPQAEYGTRASPHTARSRRPPAVATSCVAPASDPTGSGSVRLPEGDHITQRRLRCGTTL